MTPKYPALADAIADAMEGMSPERFAADVGCGMSTLRRWMDGTHFPRSASHRRELERKGVPKGVLNPRRVRPSDDTQAAA